MTQILEAPANTAQRAERKRLQRDIDDATETAEMLHQIKGNNPRRDELAVKYLAHACDLRGQLAKAYAEARR